jgi:hypothetical protein
MYKIFILIIIITFIFHILNKYSFETFTNINDLIVLTYDNGDILTSHTNNLINLLKKNNIKSNVIGSGQKWEGWYGRTMEYKKYIDNIEDDEKIIVICDGRDVLLNNSIQSEIINKANNLCDLDTQIIFGAERFCCVGVTDENNRIDGMDKNQNLWDIYQELLKKIAMTKYPDYKNDYFYLNYGQMIGKVKNLKYFYNNLDIKPEDGNDQGSAYKFLYLHQDKIVLDNKQELFTNVSNENCPLEYDDNYKKFKQTDTNTYPSFIHCPGGNWNCYKKCVNKLLENYQNPIINV